MYAVLEDNLYDALVARVYSTGQSDGDWQEVLGVLVQQFNCWSAHLMGFESASGAMLFTHEAGSPPPEASLDYIRTWHRSDPRNQVLFSAAPERWVHCHEHLSEEFVATNPFYQDFLIPYGSRYVSGMHFPATAEITCVLSFQRGVAQLPFDEAERSVIERIGKHVKAAFLLQAQSLRRLRSAVAGHAVLRRISHPVLLLDEHRCILFENSASHALLQSTNTPVAERQGVLTISDHRANADLNAFLCLRHLSAKAKADVPAVSEATIPVRHHNEVTLVLHIAHMRPEETLGCFGSTPVHLVTAYPVSHQATIDARLLAVVFELTPAEARVATLAAKGLSDTVIAQTVGTAVSTVRTQLRRVFDKLEITKRAELAQLLNGNPAFWVNRSPY